MKKILALVVLATVVYAGIFFVAKWDVGIVPDGRLTAVASYYTVYDFARQVGGDKVRVTNITPAGAEPHDYEPSAKTLADAQQADVFIFNGGTFEPWVASFIMEYRHTSVMGGSGVSLRKGNDPHFWLDPVAARQIVANIRDGFVKADPENKDYYAARAMLYAAKLDTLDKDFKKALASCAQRTIVSSHNAFGYLADRYDFEIEAIAGLSPKDEPSPARLAELSNLVRQKGVNYIFFESLASPRLADTIAQETGAQTLVLDPIEGLSNEDQKQGKDYVSVQRENLANLRKALACE